MEHVFKKLVQFCFRILEIVLNKEKLLQSINDNDIIYILNKNSIYNNTIHLNNSYKLHINVVRIFD